jgi:hypothetical protein
MRRTSLPRSRTPQSWIPRGCFQRQLGPAAASSASLAPGQMYRECTLPPRPVYRDVDEHLYDSDGDLIGAPLYDPWLRPWDDDDSAAPAPTAARAPGGAWRVSPADDSAAPAPGERLRREEEEDRPWLPMPTGGGGGAHSGAPGLPGLAQCHFCRMDPPDHLGRDCPSRALGGAAPAPGKAPPPGAYAKAPPPHAYANPYTKAPPPHAYANPYAKASPALARAPAQYVVVYEAPLGTTLALAESRTTLALAGVASPPLTQTSAASSASLAPGQICGSGSRQVHGSETRQSNATGERFVPPQTSPQPQEQQAAAAAAPEALVEEYADSDTMSARAEALLHDEEGHRIDNDVFDDNWRFVEEVFGAQGPGPHAKGSSAHGAASSSGD